jgi:hypothetical protein
MKTKLSFLLIAFTATLFWEGCGTNQALMQRVDTYEAERKRKNNEQAARRARLMQDMEEKIKNVDFGTKPTPEEALELAQKIYNPLLLDPTSGIYRVWQPVKGFDPGATGPHQEGALDVETWTYGWWVHVGVNGKNKFGGYAGETSRRILIKNGKVVAFQGESYHYPSGIFQSFSRAGSGYPESIEGVQKKGRVW